MPQVAIKGSITATAGTDITFGGKADKGAWSAAAVVETVDPKLAVGTAPVLHQATCTFTFTGTLGNNPPVPVTGTSTVTLTAKATALQGGQSDVLVQGDLEKDTYGNTLTVTVPGSSKLISGAR